MAHMYRILDRPRVAIQSVGAYIPWYFNRFKRARLIPYYTGAQCALRRSITSSETFIPVDDVDLLARFPAADADPAEKAFQIEGERVLYTSLQLFEEAPGFVGCTRGIDTTPAAHSLGAAIYEFVGTHRYILGHNPGGHVHQGIDTVYVNGIAKPASVPPTHTISLATVAVGEDERTGGDVSVAVVDFDMTTLEAITSELLQPTTITTAIHHMTQNIYSPNGTLLRTGQAIGSVSGTGAGSPGAAPRVFGGGFSAVGVDEVRYVTRTIPPPPPTIGYAPPQLGSVTADIRGLKDDGSGSITGTPNALLKRPAHITEMIMRQAYQQGSATFDATWDDALAKQASFNMEWAFGFVPMDFRAFAGLVELQSRTFITQNKEGVWQAIFRNRGVASTTLEPARRVAFTWGWTPRQQVFTDLVVSYGQGENQKELTVESETALDVSEPQTGGVTFPWIVKTGLAEQEGEDRLSLVDHQRRQGRATMTWDAATVLKSDIVAVEHPSLAPYGETLQWRVRGVSVRPDFLIDVDLDEDDPAESIPPGVREMDLTFRLGNPIFARDLTFAILSAMERDLTFEIGFPILTRDLTFEIAGDSGLLEDGDTFFLEDGTPLELES